MRSRLLGDRMKLPAHLVTTLGGVGVCQLSGVSQTDKGAGLRKLRNSIDAAADAQKVHADLGSAVEANAMREVTAAAFLLVS
jgi:hypothetical protein